MASTKLTWTLGVRISGGPSLSFSGHLGVDAYDKIDVAIPENATDYIVEIQPGKASKVMILLVKADIYEDITYKVNNEGDPIILNNLHLYLGTGAAALLQQTTPKVLSFTNGNDKPVNVEILAGRKATS